MRTARPAALVGRAARRGRSHRAGRLAGARHSAAGSWAGRGLQLSLPGTWRIEAVIVRAGTAVVIPLMVPVAARLS
jgi:hypothetical protein